MDLPGFLLARFDDDEAVARESGADAMVGWRWKHYPPEAYEEVQSLTLAHSARTLAECEAKRAIVGLFVQLDAVVRQSSLVGDRENERDSRNSRFAVEMTMRALALPYADHPDYDEAWRL